VSFIAKGATLNLKISYK